MHIFEAGKYDPNEEAENAKKSNMQDSQVTATKKPWKVYSDNHPKSQAYLRHPEKTSADWQDFHRKVVRAVEKNGKNGIHVVHSTSHGHGIVVHANQKERRMKIHTILDYGQNKATQPSDIKLQAESVIWIL